MMKMRGRKQKRECAAAIDRSRKLLLAGRYQENLEFLSQAIQEFPEDAELQLLYATMLLEFRPADVAAAATKAVELGSDDPVILVRAGNLLFSRAEVEAARSCAARANELAGPNFVLTSGLANLNGLLAALDGDDAIAEEKLRFAVENDPAYSSFAIELAKFLASRHRVAEAIEVIDEALLHVKEKEELERLRGELASA